MTWRPKSPAIAAGTLFGCWLTVRFARFDPHGRRHYLARAACCGREKVIRQYNLEHSKATQCVGCASRARAIARKAARLAAGFQDAP